MQPHVNTGIRGEKLWWNLGVPKSWLERKVKVSIRTVPTKLTNKVEQKKFAENVRSMK